MRPTRVSRLLPLRTLLVSASLAAALSPTLTYAQSPHAPMGLLPLAFEQNLGQADASVLYLAHTSSGVMRFTRTQVQLPCAGGQGGLSFNIRSLGQQPANVHTKGAVSGRVNYYPSSDRSAWIEGVALQPELDYSQIAQGVDLVFHGDEGRLEYDFEVAAEANPDAVWFAPDSGASFSLQSDGSARLDTASANNCSAEGIRLLAPIAYQTRNGHRIPIQVAFRLDSEGQLGFSVASYDHHLPLVIDPVVSYTHIIGINNSTTVNGVEADSSGNVYITGETAATNYPVVGGQSGISSGSEEVYITKLDPTGTQILFSTYIPAPGFNSASAIALDPSGNVYVAGVTGSASFPTTSQNLGTCSSFCNTGFAAKFSPAGTMVYSTLLGSGQQLPKSIVVDAEGELYIAGLTADSGLQTVNSFQSTYLGGLCTSCTGPFFGKLNAAGDAWMFSSYFSSGAYDALEAFASGIALDTTGNVYIAGSGNTVPLQNWFENGVGQYFVAEFSPNGQSLIFSTLLGGNSSSQYDSIAPVQVGTDGTIYLAGSEYAPDFPFTANAFLLPVGQSNFPRLFALAINPAHTGLTYSTSLGTGNATATALDAKGNFYIGGSYSIGSLPFKNALAHDSLNSGFIAELDPTGTVLNATGFGGRNTRQVPAGLGLDGSGNIYVAGAPDSTGISNGILDPINIGTGTAYSAQSSLGLSTTFEEYSTFIAKITPANQPQISLSYENPFLELRNAGSADLHISSVQVSGGFASANSTCGSTLPGGTSCFLTPANSSGDTANGNVTINSDAVPASQSFTPSSASVGNNAPIGGNLVIDASQMVFAPQQTGTTSPARTLTLTNTGTASFTINSILTFGYFAETNNCGVLAPQASCTAQITVSPTATGSSSGDIGIVYNTNVRTDAFAYFTPNPTTSPLLVSMPTIGFGSLFPSQQSLPRVVTITNTSNSVTSVDTPTIDGPDASSFNIAGNTCAGVSLQPQQSCAVSVVYQAPASGASVFATLNITDGSAAADTVPLYGSIITKPTISISPGTFSFGTLIVGQTVQQVFQITNTWSADETLSNIYILLANSVTPPEYSLQNTCTAALSPSNSCAVTVAFTPGTAGTYNAVLSISINSGNAANGSTAVQTLPIAATVVPPFSVSPSNLTFPSTIVGSTSATQSITITNNLSTPISSLALAITGSNAADFSQTPSCPASLAAGANCTAQITFKPSTSSVETATLAITSSDGSASQTVALSGTGIAPDFSITASSSSSTITPGQVATYNLSFTAPAGFAGDVNLRCSGLPAFATCSFNPASVTITGGTTSTSVLSVTAAAQASLKTTNSIQFATPLFSALLVLALTGRRRKLATRIVCSLTFAVVGFLLVSASGCSGGGSSSPPPPSEVGTYTFTVTAVSGTVTHTSTLTLIIQ